MKRKLAEATKPLKLNASAWASKMANPFFTGHSTRPLDVFAGLTGGG